MKKIDPQIKNDFTLKMQDEIDAIEMIADMFFRDIEDDDGNITTKYTPYLEKIGQVNAIVRYFLTGIEFDDGEDVYDAVMEDKDIEPLVKKFMVPYGEKIEEPTREQKIMGQIMDKVYDMIEFRKAKMIAQTQNESNAILTYKILELIEKEREKNEKEIATTENLNAWVDEQRKQQEELNAIVTPEMQKEFIEKFDVNSMTESIYKKIAESDLHKRNQEVVQLTREKRELENKLIDAQSAFAREQQKETAKNVLADKQKSNTYNRKPKKTVEVEE